MDEPTLSPKTITRPISKPTVDTKTQRSSGYRSAYRSSYRAIVNHKEYTKKNYKDTFANQSIICGGILCIVLFSSIIHIPVAESINEKLTLVIKDTQAQNSKYGFFEGIKESVQSIFQEEPQDTNMTTETETNSVNTNSVDMSSSEDFRIDEDILEEMNAKQDFYGEDEKKTIVPGEQSKTLQKTLPEQQMENQQSQL